MTDTNLPPGSADSSPSPRTGFGRRPRRACVIFNPAAGTAEKLTDDLLEQIERGATLRPVSDPQEIPSSTQAAAADGFSRIIVAGGDGTIHSAINALADDFPHTEMGILPVGTGNDLARAVGIPLDDLPAAVDLLLNGTAQPTDLGRARFANGPCRYFANMCYGGFGGRISDAVEPETKARWGMFAYWVTLARRALDLPEHAVTLEWDSGGDEAEQTETPTAAGTPVQAETRLHGVLVANSIYAGGGVAAAPQARLDDGLFDVALVPVQSAWDALQTTVDLWRGQLHESEHVVSFRARRLRIAADPEFAYTTDGESAPHGPIELEVAPRAIRLVTGPQAPGFS